MGYDVYGVGNALLDIQYDVTEDFLKEQGIGKGLMTYTEHDRQMKSCMLLVMASCVLWRQVVQLRIA